MKRTLIFIAMVMSCSTYAQQQVWTTSSKEKQFSMALDESTTASKMDANGRATIDNKLVPSAAKSKSRHDLFLQSSDLPLNQDYWIYDAWLELTNDIDYDGHYSTLTLSFDADTVFAHADVFARLYLSWGDEFYEYHTTSVFAIDGDDSEDFLEVETELLEGFPTNDYEILIDLYRADTEELVATYSSDNDDDLIYVPLESFEYEYVPVSVETQVTVSHEQGGGSMGAMCWALLLLCLIRLYNPRHIKSLV